MGKITDYTALSSTQPDDVLPIVDVHDFTQAGTGSTKKITVANLLATAGGLANPMTTSGDTLYGGTAGAPTRLAGDVSNTRKFLREQASGGVAQPPVWDTLLAADVPTLNQNTTGTASNVTGTVAIANGGTGQVTQQAALDALAGATTNNQVLAGNGTHVTLRALAAADLPAATTSAQGAVILDGTAGDIQAPGTQAAGSSTKAAAADHVHPASFTATAFVAPKVASLTDAATIAIDASQGNVFRVTIAGNRTLGNPTNPVDGQPMWLEVTQDATGSRTLAYGTAYSFATGLAAPTLTTTASKTDVLGFRYNSTKAKWLFVGFVLGFS